MVLQLHVNVSLNRPPDRTWRRPPGRPRNKWLDQLRNDSTRPAGDVLSTVDMVVQRRDGPRWLHDDDDDLERELGPALIQTTGLFLDTLADKADGS